MAIDTQSDIVASLTKMAENTSKVQKALQAEKGAKALADTDASRTSVVVERAPTSPLTEPKR